MKSFDLQFSAVKFYATAEQDIKKGDRCVVEMNSENELFITKLDLELEKLKADRDFEEGLAP